jgi:hypothetical protein
MMRGSGGVMKGVVIRDKLIKGGAHAITAQKRVVSPLFLSI